MSNISMLVKFINKILLEKNRVALSLMHDDQAAHEIVSKLTMELASSFNIHVLVEEPEEMVRENYAGVKTRVDTLEKLERLQKHVRSFNLPPPMELAFLAKASGTKVVGIDVDKMTKLKWYQAAQDEISQDSLEQRFSHESEMQCNIEHAVDTVDANNNSAFILIIGNMHGSVPRNLGWDNIAILEKKSATNFVNELDVTCKSNHAIKTIFYNKETVRPKYTFLYDQDQGKLSRALSGTKALGKSTPLFMMPTD